MPRSKQLPIRLQETGSKRQNTSDKGQDASSKAPESNTNNQITIDDFAKIELRTGIITAAEKVEKADKLLKLQIDLGYETRTILSGIALYFKPEEIIGRQVTVVANLAPRKDAWHRKQWYDTNGRRQYRQAAFCKP